MLLHSEALNLQDLCFFCSFLEQVNSIDCAGTAALGACENATIECNHRLSEDDACVVKCKRDIGGIGLCEGVDLTCPIGDGGCDVECVVYLLSSVFIALFSFTGSLKNL